MTNPEAGDQPSAPAQVKQSPQEDGAIPKSAFLEKVSDIPVVNAAKEYGTAAYNQVKQMNTLANLTLTKAESTLLYFALAAKPFLNTFQPQAKLVDDMAVRGLEAVESKAPFLMKTPEEMIEEARKLCALTLETSYQKVGEVKDLGTGAISSVKNYGLQKASHALSTTERLVDHFLPPAHGEGSGSSSSIDNQSIKDQATRLTTKVSQRVYGHGVKQFLQVQKLSQDSVTKLLYTIELLQQIKENVGNKSVQEYVDEAKVKATWIWDELNKEPAEASEANKSLEQRMLSLARRITSTLVHTYAALPLGTVPQTCMDGVKNVRSYAAELFTQFDEAVIAGDFAQNLIQRALSTISALESAIKTMVDGVQPKETIEMQELSPQEKKPE